MGCEPGELILWDRYEPSELHLREHLSYFVAWLNLDRPQIRNSAEKLSDNEEAFRSERSRGESSHAAITGRRGLGEGNSRQTCDYRQTGNIR